MMNLTLEPIHLWFVHVQRFSGVVSQSFHALSDVEAAGLVIDIRGHHR